MPLRQSRSRDEIKMAFPTIPAQTAKFQCPEAIAIPGHNAGTLRTDADRARFCFNALRQSRSRDANRQKAYADWQKADAGFNALRQSRSRDAWVIVGIALLGAILVGFNALRQSRSRDLATEKSKAKKLKFQCPEAIAIPGQLGTEGSSTLCGVSMP